MTIWKNPFTGLLADTLQKARQFLLCFIYKILTLYVTRLIFNLPFTYKKHNNLRYVTFLYTQIQTLSKKQDNLRYIFIYKNPDTLRYSIFHRIFEIDGGGGIFMNQKNAPCVKSLYEKNNAISVTF